MQQRVVTKSSVYYIDLEEMTLMRVPIEGSAAKLRKDSTIVPLLAVEMLEVGKPLVVAIDVRGDGVSTVRMTTEVVSID